MNTARQVHFVAAHYNRAAETEVADYWYFTNDRDVRMLFDTEEEAIEAAEEWGMKGRNGED